MQSVLRQIVASPRARHPEARLDLCYVTDYLIATSGPSATYPSRAYRNPLDALVRFLDAKHGAAWAIWEFRAEGTGYPDEAVYGRIVHWPWPDHHPPPFGLLPGIVGGMRAWLRPVATAAGGEEEKGKGEGEEKKKGRVVVVHCKAGKGRSGTVACSYLMSEEGWGKEDAKNRFTERRMRPGFGAGISIPSQIRWLDYVERWIRGGKVYVERTVEVTEVHVWGLREGVKLAVEGFVENGKVIKTFHVFTKEERDDVEEVGPIKSSSSFADIVSEALRRRGQGSNGGEAKSREESTSPVTHDQPADSTAESAKPQTLNTNVASSSSHLLAVAQSPSGASTPESTTSKASRGKSGESTGVTNVIFRPSSRIVIPTSDINLAVERRSLGGYGWTIVTSVGHVWFNCFFEGNGPENISSSSGGHGAPDDGGVFTIDWDAMDGIKGSSRKGARAFDRVAVVWRAVPASDPSGRGRDSFVITEPAAGEAVKGSEAADWRVGAGGGEESMAKELGPLDQKEEAAEKAQNLEPPGSSAPPMSVGKTEDQEDEEDSEDGAEGVQRGLRLPEEGDEAGKHGSTGNVPGGELRDRQEHPLGDVKLNKKGDITSS